MGTPHVCHLSEYMRTIVYEIPGFIVWEADDIAPARISETPGVRAAVVTNPQAYIRGDNFSNQYELDRGLREELRDLVEANEGKSEKVLYIVVQVKDDMGSAPAVNGQCIKTTLADGTEMISVVDCEEVPVHRPDERTRSINSVLTAVRMEYEVTEGITRVINQGCYLSDNGECVYRFGVGGSAYLRVRSPISPDAIAQKSSNCRELFDSIEANIEDANNGSRCKWRTDFGEHLQDLVEGLQLEPSTDDSYHRLWFLRLCHVAEEFGRTCKWQFRNDQKTVRKYRDDVAHPGVEKIDMGMLKSFQRELFRVIRSKL